MRNGLLCGLLTAVSNNEKRGYPDLNLFELGTVFDGDMPTAQHTSLCVVRTGNTSPRHWTSRNRAVDIYDVKADLVALLRGQKFTVSTDAVGVGVKGIGCHGRIHIVMARCIRVKPRLQNLVNCIHRLQKNCVSRQIRLLRLSKM